MRAAQKLPDETRRANEGEVNALVERCCRSARSFGWRSSSSFGSVFSTYAALTISSSDWAPLVALYRRPAESAPLPAPLPPLVQVLPVPPRVYLASRPWWGFGGWGQLRRC